MAHPCHTGLGMLKATANEDKYFFEEELEEEIVDDEWCESDELN